MPLVIKKFKSGFRVCEQTDPKTCYSKMPLTKKRASKQELAIRLSKLRKQGRIPPRK
jgi:hypothetical protein